MTDLPAWLQAVRQQQARNQPAWQRQPEAQPGYTPPRPRPRQMRPPLQRLYDPNQGVRDQAAAEVRLGRDVARTDERAAGGYSGYADRNQVEEFGRGAMEATGAPAWARGIRNLQHGRPGEAIPEFLWGALNTAGVATLPLGGGARVPTRPAPPMRVAASVEQPVPISAPPIEAPPQRPLTTQAPDAGQSGAGRRVPLTELSRQDPLNATFPWEQRNTPTDEMVRDALARGAVRGAGSDAEVSSWGAREHAERIATLMRDGWSDPISLRRVEGRLAVDDGYHRLAAARLRGDADILARAPDGGASGAVTFAREINGRREFNTPNITVFVENTSDSPQPMLHWELRDDRLNSLTDTETLAGRSRLQQEGIAAAIDTIRRDGGSAYRIRGATESMGRRYLRLAQEQAEAAGYRFRQDGGDLIVERRAPDAPNAGPSRPPPRPRPPPSRVSAELDQLLQNPIAREAHAQDATIAQVSGRYGALDTVYDYRLSPARTQVFFRPEGDGQTFAITMSAGAVRANSAMSVKMRAFADAIAAIEHHAMHNQAARRGFRYIFAGESDAHTRLFRGLAERATWPRGAVIHDTPGGFEISFDPTRAPFSGRAVHGYAFDTESGFNLGQETPLRLSYTINNRTREITSQLPPPRPRPPPRRPQQ